MAKASGGTGNYDYLVKLLLIGDSGQLRAKRRGRLLTVCPTNRCGKELFVVAILR